MRILIDADGCPVVREAVKAAEDYRLECVIFCDTSHEFNSSYARVVTVSKGADSADLALVNAAHSGDIAVTQDYGLAAMCLSRGCEAIDQDGTVFDDTNIDSMLFARYNAKKIRMSGGRLKGPSKRKPEQNKRFFESLCRLIEKSIK